MSQVLFGVFSAIACLDKPSTSVHTRFAIQNPAVKPMQGTSVMLLQEQMYLYRFAGQEISVVTGQTRTDKREPTEDTSGKITKS